MVSESDALDADELEEYRCWYIQVGWLVTDLFISSGMVCVRADEELCRFHIRQVGFLKHKTCGEK